MTAVNMLYRRLDVDGDFSFGRGHADYLSGVDAVAQAIDTRLKLLQGEWWEDLADGLPLWQSILGARADTETLDGLYISRILGTPNVTGISNFSSSFAPGTRVYSFSCTVNTVFGQINNYTGGA